MSESNNSNDRPNSGNFMSRLFIRPYSGQIPAPPKIHREKIWSKEEDEKKTTEYSFIMCNFVANVADSDRTGFRKRVAAYMQEKKQNYAGLGYLEQMEKNYIYHERALVALTDHFNMFLLGQTRAPRKENIDLELNQIRLTKRQESLAHIRYLAFGCDGCDYHHDHTKFSKLRELRLADMDGYLDEMEFGCQFYVASALLCQGCLATLWQQPAGLFQDGFNWDKTTMNDMLYQYVKHVTSAILNNTPLRDRAGKLLNYLV